jgi:hypothetical protein
MIFVCSLDCVQWWNNHVKHLQDHYDTLFNRFQFDNIFSNVFPFYDSTGHVFRINSSTEIPQSPRFPRGDQTVPEMKA